MRRVVRDQLKFLFVLIFGISFATALIASHGEDPEQHMRKAYTALDLLEAHENPDMKFRGVESLEQYFTQTGRFAYFTVYKDLEDSRLRHVAEEELLQALNLGDPYAAIQLCKVYKDEESKVKLIAVLKKSIEHKKSTGSAVGLKDDVDRLLALERISLKSLAGIARIVDIDIDRAVACFGYIADHLAHPESEVAFESLLKLQERPDSWLHIACAYFCRKKPEEGLVWVDKTFREYNNYEDRALEILENRVRDHEVPFKLRLHAARLFYAHTAAESHKSFHMYLEYYKLLKDAEVEGDDVSGELIKVGGALAMVAENQKQTTPKYLTDLASVLYRPELQGADLDPIIDLYVRAVDAGCYEARKILAGSQRLLERMGLMHATLFIVRHNLGEDLFQMHKRINNPALLVILSFMADEESDSDLAQKSSGLIEGFPDNYVPFVDLQILKLNKRINSLSQFINDAKQRINYAFGYHRSQFVFIPTDAYHQSGYKFTSKTKANEFLAAKTNILGSLEVERDLLVSKKKLAVDLLGAQQLFELSQDYLLIHRACEVISPNMVAKFFLTDHYGVLELSADKGYLPAVEQLISLYDNGISRKHYSSENRCKVLSFESTGEPNPEKSEFYRNMKALLEDGSLALLEKAEQFQAMLERKG